MEIRAKNDVTIKNIETGKNYKTLGIIYVIGAVLSLVLFFFIDSNINFVLMFIVSFLGMMLMYWNNNKIQNKQYEMTECYIRLSDTYLEFMQLVDGQYQIGKVFIKEISRIMKVEEGFQIWFDSKSGNSRFMLDDDVVDIETACINFYGYDTDEYIDMYLAFVNKLEDNVEKDLDTADWKEDTETKEWLKLILPAFLYIVPIVLCIIG
jgi:hypothetical protein